MTEDSIQAQIVKWFNNSYCLKHHSPRSLIFSVPNGGSRHKLEALKLKATGMLAGVSDLIIVHRSRIYFCELKTEKGYQSSSQKEFEQRVTENGLQYLFFRSFEDFKEFFLNL